jgi:preprotein translocase subunit SecF
MASFSEFGNDLYTGKRSFDFVGKRKLWYGIAAGLILIAIVVPNLRGGWVFGIEFTGGSQFQISQLEVPDQGLATDAVNNTVSFASPRVSVVGNDSIRVQTELLTTGETADVREALAVAFDVPPEEVTTSFIGATWGADITQSALTALVVFFLLATLLMALYFRTWKMALAAMLALVHDLVLTAGIYGILGFEVTPAAVIGFLTILGYSLYDTVVVFDKIRENTSEDGESSTRTFAQSVNLAVNQTLVRSINTSVVALLPVSSILFIGSYVLGAGTLRDISLALFIGIAAGAYSTIFLAAPIYSHLRENEPQIEKKQKRIASASAKTSGAVR